MHPIRALAANQPAQAIAIGLVVLAVLPLNLVSAFPEAPGSLMAGAVVGSLALVILASAPLTGVAIDVAAGRPTPRLAVPTAAYVASMLRFVGLLVAWSLAIGLPATLLPEPLADYVFIAGLPLGILLMPGATIAPFLALRDGGGLRAAIAASKPLGRAHRWRVFGWLVATVLPGLLLDGLFPPHLAKGLLISGLDGATAMVFAHAIASLLRR